MIYIRHLGCKLSCVTVMKSKEQVEEKNMRVDPGVRRRPPWPAAAKLFGIALFGLFHRWRERGS